MSSQFHGFTQQEICKINSKSVQANKPNSGKVRDRKMNTADSKRSVNTASESANSKAMTETPSAELSESTIQAFQEAMHFCPLNAPTSNIQTPNTVQVHKQLNGNDAPSAAPIDSMPSQISPDDGYNGNLESGGRATMLNGISLKDFEKHQQLLKEANLEKRRLLRKAIEQKFEQSIAEATKVSKIREELDKLDQELAVEVEILRQEIEAVAVKYTNSKENYHKIESQFLAARLSFHQISEKKELLTEHLCTIITHNENRKAKRLSELLEQVGLDANDLAEDNAKPTNEQNDVSDLNNDK